MFLIRQDRSLGAFRVAAVLLASASFLLTGCRHRGFPEYPENYHEFAYVTGGASNTVTVLDLVYLRRERVLQVGRNPNPGANTRCPLTREAMAFRSGYGAASIAMLHPE